MCPPLWLRCNLVKGGKKCWREMQLTSPDVQLRFLSYFSPKQTYHQREVDQYAVADQSMLLTGMYASRTHVTRLMYTNLHYVNWFRAYSLAPDSGRQQESTTDRFISTVCLLASKFHTLCIKHDIVSRSRYSKKQVRQCPTQRNKTPSMIVQ